MENFRKNEISVKRAQSNEFSYVFDKIGIKSLLRIHVEILKKKMEFFLFRIWKKFRSEKKISEKKARFFHFFRKVLTSRTATQSMIGFLGPQKEFKRSFMIISFDWDRCYDKIPRFWLYGANLLNWITQRSHNAKQTFWRFSKCMSAELLWPFSEKLH